MMEVAEISRKSKCIMFLWGGEHTAGGTKTKSSKFLSLPERHWPARNLNKQSEPALEVKGSVMTAVLTTPLSILYQPYRRFSWTCSPRARALLTRF